MKPMGQSHVHDQNQLRAWQSWQKVATAIVYFGEPQPGIEGPTTRYLPSEDYPRIMDLSEFMAEQGEWCALLNADIYISPHFKNVEAKLKGRKALAASSWRHEFDPAVGVDPCQRVDNGLDFFAAVPDIWARIYQIAEEPMRMGTVQYDSLLLSYFSCYAISGFYDITPSKCVRHPRHGNETRKYGPYGGPYHFPVWPNMSPITIE
jgi:hypothetical protein